MRSASHFSGHEDASPCGLIGCVVPLRGALFFPSTRRLRARNLPIAQLFSQFRPVKSGRIKTVAKSDAVRSSLQNVYTTRQVLTNFCQMTTQQIGRATSGIPLPNANLFGHFL